MKNLEVEGGEIAIKNKNGDVAIIPKEKVAMVETLIAQGKYSQVDALISMLPKMANKAASGSVIGDPVKKKLRTEADNVALQKKYGSGVKHREIYMDLYDKEIPATQIRGGYDIWRDNKNLTPELLEFQTQWRDLDKQESDYSLNLDNRLKQVPDYSDPYNEENQTLNQLRMMSEEDRYNSKEYIQLLRDKNSEIWDKKRYVEDQFQADPNSQISQDNKATSWRQLIEGRDDIEDKELLYTSLMDEGADQFTYNVKGGESGLYSGYSSFGLDSFGERLGEFEKKGYIDKEMRNRIVLRDEVNEKNENRVSADFKSLDDVVTAKNAFIKSGKSSIQKKAKELGVTLSKTAMDYFTVASYNLGEGGTRKMLAAYHKAGILDNDKFMDDTSYDGYREPHRNAKRRVQAMNMLRGEETLASANKKGIPKTSPFPIKT